MALLKGMKTDAASLVLLAGELAFFAIRGYYIQKVGKAVKVAKNRSVGFERIFAQVWHAIFNGIPGLYALTNLLDFANYAPGGPTGLACLAGGLLIALGLWVFQRAHADLGTMWSVTLKLREKHKLIRSGIYSFVRHPMYLSTFFFGPGKLILAPNLMVVAAVLVCFFLIVYWRIPKEEQMMLNDFGSDYKKYMAEVGGLVPKSLQMLT